MRSFIAILTAAFIGLAFTPTSASARFGGGGFHGGGFHGGFHGGGFGFRPGIHHFGPRFGFRRGFGFPLVGAAVGLGIAASSPWWGYGYGGGCLVPRRVWTPWGWRTRWIDVCY
jgi:hypothetical protein